MRIVHTCLRYPPATGGVETYVRDVVQRTRNTEEHRDVRVLTSRMRTHGPITSLKPLQLREDPPYVQRLAHSKTPLISYPRLQSLDYYLGHHQPNILTAYSFWYQPADVAARFARRTHTPFIFYPMYYENKLRRKPVWQIYKKTIGRSTFAAADIVAVISPYEQSLIEAAGFQVKRFELLPPGIDIAKFTVRQPSIFEAKKITGRIILSVGRVARGKGLSDTIAAMPDVIKQFPDANLVIAGEDFGAKADLKREADSLGIAGHVHFLGKVSASELVAAYQHADLFVHASYYEAFGIVLGEALAAGAPVIARRTSAIPYVVPDKQAGLLFNNPVELTSHIIHLLQHDNERQALADRGRAYVIANFTWDRTIRKLLSLYQEFKKP